MTEMRNEAGEVEGIGLAEAIAQLREDLLAARKTSAGAEIQLPVESLTVELKVVATNGVDGKAGFKVPVIGAELGGSATWNNEATQTVTVRFGGPVDRHGEPVKIASPAVRAKS
jgi:Trypsin-co-occurring domain 2